MLMFNADELFEKLGLTAVNCEDCKHHNKDYISKCDNSTWRDVCDILDYMTPIDAVPVVRCKDCFLYGECQAAKFYGDDGYCSVGERKEDD